mgnify:CR=1 FL=1
MVAPGATHRYISIEKMYRFLVAEPCKQCILGASSRYIDIHFSHTGMDRLGINVLDPLGHPRGSSETIFCWATRKHSKPTHELLMNHSWVTHKKPINVGHLAMSKRFCFWLWLGFFSRLCALCWLAGRQSSWRQMPVRLLVPGRWPASQKYSKTFEFWWKRADGVSKTP